MYTTAEHENGNNNFSSMCPSILTTLTISFIPTAKGTNNSQTSNGEYFPSHRSAPSYEYDEIKNPSQFSQIIQNRLSSSKGGTKGSQVYQETKTPNYISQNRRRPASKQNDTTVTATVSPQTTTKSNDINNGLLLYAVFPTIITFLVIIIICANVSTPPVAQAEDDNYDYCATIDSEYYYAAQPIISLEENNAPYQSPIHAVPMKNR